MKELFKNYEINGGYCNIVRFLKYVNDFGKVSEKKKISKMYDEFVEVIRKEELLVSKSYLNFRKYVLSKISK